MPVAEITLDGRRLALRAATLAEVVPLRHRVLRPGLPADTAVFDGDDEPATRHFAAVDAGAVVSCLTLMARPYDGRPAEQLRGMATRPDVARRGIGRALLRFVEAGLEPGTLVWCNARVGSAEFYRRCGWRVVSAPFEIAGVGPHVVMVGDPA